MAPVVSNLLLRIRQHILYENNNNIKLLNE